MESPFAEGKGSKSVRRVMTCYSINRPMHAMLINTWLNHPPQILNFQLHICPVDPKLVLYSTCTCFSSTQLACFPFFMSYLSCNSSACFAFFCVCHFFSDVRIWNFSGHLKFNQPWRHPILAVTALCLHFFCIYSRSLQWRSPSFSFFSLLKKPQTYSYSSRGSRIQC